MPLNRPKYRVIYVDSNLADEPREQLVEVTYGDQLRAEFEATKQGLPSIKDAPQNHVTVWVWCALVRLGLYAGDCRQFRLVDVLDVEGLDKPDEVPTVDPTQPAATSGPPSCSPATSEADPATGSTPTSTNA